MSKVITIIQVVESIVRSIQFGAEFYRQTVDFMDSMEIDSGLTGQQKKAAVLDKMREILLGKNELWERWKEKLSDFYDLIKGTYNQYKPLFS